MAGIVAQVEVKSFDLAMTCSCGHPIAGIAKLQPGPDFDSVSVARFFADAFDAHVRELPEGERAQHDYRFDVPDIDVSVTL